MGINCFNTVMKSRNVPGVPSRKLVLLNLAFHADDRTGICFPHLATIARETKLSVNTVSTVCIEMEKCGFITRKRTRRGMVYTLIAEAFSPDCDSQTERFTRNGNPNPRDIAVGKIQNEGNRPAGVARGYAEPPSNGIPRDLDYPQGEIQNGVKSSGFGIGIPDSRECDSQSAGVRFPSVGNAVKDHLTDKEPTDENNPPPSSSCVGIGRGAPAGAGDEGCEGEEWSVEGSCWD